jgi:hypothetical protein
MNEELWCSDKKDGRKFEIEAQVTFKPDFTHLPKDEKLMMKDLWMSVESVECADPSVSTVHTSMCVFLIKKWSFKS